MSPSKRGGEREWPAVIKGGERKKLAVGKRGEGEGGEEVATEKREGGRGELTAAEEEREEERRDAMEEKPWPRGREKKKPRRRRGGERSWLRRRREQNGGEGREREAERDAGEGGEMNEGGMGEKFLTLSHPGKLRKEVNLGRKSLEDQNPRSADEAETPRPEILKGLEEDIRVLRLIRDGKLNIQKKKDELDSLMKLLEELEAR